MDAEKWRGLRVSILARATQAEGEETGLMARVPSHLQAEVLKEIFASSRELGQTMATRKGHSYSVEEAVAFLSGAGIPCFDQIWRKEGHVVSKFRYLGECPQNPLMFCCDYWREAARGMISGLSSELAYARHQSIGHGDRGCLDYVCQLPHTARRWGPVPAHMKLAIAPLIERMRREGTELALEGYSEHRLFYRVKGPREKATRGVLKRRIRKRYPEISIEEVKS